MTTTRLPAPGVLGLAGFACLGLDTVFVQFPTLESVARLARQSRVNAFTGFQLFTVNGAHNSRSADAQIFCCLINVKHVVCSLCWLISAISHAVIISLFLTIAVLVALYQRWCYNAIKQICDNSL